MNYQEAVDYIHSLLVFGSQPGLERITVLLDALGNPQDGLSFIHVAGTNGKGSTCLMLSEIYRKAGYLTGLYISPYVVDFRERIQFDGQYIEKDLLATFCEQVKNTGITVTEFEFITAVAMLYFSYKKCDIVILETGLGGRFDATNIIRRNLTSVITKIDFDHMAYLGDTIEQITMEKCGIIKPGSPTVSYPLQDAAAEQVIQQHAETMILPDLSQLEILSSDLGGNTFSYHGDLYTVPLIGPHQIYNALTAIEAVGAAGLPVDQQTVIDAIASVRFPARMEIIREDPLVLLDGAHNPNGAAALEAVMRPFTGRIVAVVGMMADKNCDGFLKTVLPYCRAAVTVEVKDNPRSMTADGLADLAGRYCNKVFATESYEKAIKLAKELASGKDPIFVFGSLYLAGAVRERLLSVFN